VRIVALIVFMAIYGGLSFLLGWSIKAWLVGLGVFRWEPVYWALYFLVAFSPIIGRLHRFFRPVAVIGNVYFFLFEYGLLLAIPGALIVRFTPLDAGVVGTAVALVLFLLAAAGWFYAHSPVRRRLVLHVAKPGRVRSLRIAMASDFHVGIMSGKRHLQAFVDGVNAIKPDLVLLAGDIVDDDANWFMRRKMGDILGQLNAKHGVYGILGNHEYYGGQIPEVVEELARNGIRVLRDETVLVDDWIHLTGREDVTNRNRKPLQALKREAGLETEPVVTDGSGAESIGTHGPGMAAAPGTEPVRTDAPGTAGSQGAESGGADDPGTGAGRRGTAGLWIVMNHTPDDLATPAETGVDLHVSGHTHRGQLWPNHWITRRIFELDYGYKRKKDMHAVVSSGYGYWGPPFRTGSRSEWWDIELVFLPEHGAEGSAEGRAEAGMKRKAVVAGATGLVGSELVRQLLEDEAYGTVVSLVRRKTGHAHPKLREIITDYRALVAGNGEPTADGLDLAGADVFCALGTTIKKAGTQAAFREVDYDYPLALGRLAKAQGAARFLIVTSLGADPASRIFYSRVKGEVEEALRQLELPALDLFRPSLLLGKRQEFRFGERVAAAIMPWFSALLGKYRPVHAREVAAAMIRAAKSGGTGVRVHESHRIRELAGEEKASG
jgi:hypothetical protein